MTDDSINKLPKTTTEDRRLLRRAGYLETRQTRQGRRVYVNAPKFQAQASRERLAYLLREKLIVELPGGKWERTPAGEAVLAAHDNRGVTS